MTSVPATGPVVHPPGVTLLRVVLTYVLPGLAVLCVVLSGLWLGAGQFCRDVWQFRWPLGVVVVRGIL
jgi:hypothetical protein